MPPPEGYQWVLRTPGRRLTRPGGVPWQYHHDCMHGKVPTIYWTHQNNPGAYCSRKWFSSGRTNTYLLRPIPKPTHFKDEDTFACCKPQRP